MQIPISNNNIYSAKLKLKICICLLKFNASIVKFMVFKWLDKSINIAGKPTPHNHQK
jgi:hypothetical protein